jgi:hypothetical protein
MPLSVLLQLRSPTGDLLNVCDPVGSHLDASAIQPLNGLTIQMTFCVPTKRRNGLQIVGIPYNFIEILLQLWVQFYLFIKTLRIDHK